MKTLSVLLLALGLQACALGALSESEVHVQPIFTPSSTPQETNIVHPEPVHKPPIENTEIHEQSGSKVKSYGVDDDLIISPDSARLDGGNNFNIHATSVFQSAQTKQLSAQAFESFQLAGELTTPAGDTYLQVGMFRSQEGAEQVQANAQAVTDAQVYISSNDRGEYRVLVGPVAPQDAAHVKAQLEAAGLSYFRQITPLRK